MKAGWQRKSLGDVCTVERIQSIHKQLPYVGLEHIEPHTGRFVGSVEPLGVKSSTFKFTSQHVLYGRLRPYLSKVMAPEFTGHCSTEIFPIKPNSELSREFLQYWFLKETTVSLINATCTGARMPRANMDAILDFEFLLPPLPEQLRIVAILDKASDRIAIAKANAEKNLQNARALFESHLQSVFARRDGRSSVPIGDVAEVFDGPHATPKTVDTGPVFLGISALQDGNVNLGETRHVTPEDFRKWTRRIRPQAEDVVFSYETRLGQAAIIPENLVCCLGRRMGLVRVDQRKVDPRFFVYQYISPPFREYLNSRTVRGATVDRIALKEFPSFPITLLPLSEQKRMADRFDALRVETQRLESIYERKLAALDELKKSLLHQAFTGEL